MANPYFNSHSFHSFYPGFQTAYEPVMSRSGLVLNDCPQRSGLAFGLQVQQTAPSNYLNILTPCSECIHNTLSDPRYKKVPIRVIYSQESDQSRPLVLSQKSLLNDTARYNFSGIGPSTSQSLSLEDTFRQSDKEARARYQASNKGKETRTKYEASDKGKVVRARYQASDQRKDSRVRYEASDKGKVARARYQASDQRKESRVRYEASDKGKVARARARAKYKASDKGKMARARYQASDKGKETKARYAASDKGKQIKAINNAKSNGYRSALRKGFSDAVAREIGQSAANAKKAELLSVAPPLFSHQTEEIFTVPVETLLPWANGQQ